MASTVPGSRLPRLAQSVLGIARPVEARMAMRERYGPVFRTNDLIVGELVHVAEPRLVAEIFKWKPSDYNVAEPRAPMEPVTGPSSILLLDGDRHLRMRKLMLPPFHGEAIAHFERLIAEITDREVDGWLAGARIRTRAVAQAVTMEVIIRAVFGVTHRERVAELMGVLPRLSSVNPLLAVQAARRDLGPRSPWGRFIRDRARADALIYEEIGRRRAGEIDGDEPAILALLLRATDEDGAPLTDRELRDELITLLLAGHETTATSIGWAFERLLRAPAALRRATEEARAGGSTDYIDAVIKETLRLRPVITEVFRAPTRPVELDGHCLAAGDRLAVAIMLVQYDPELYPPDPLVFRPERFLDGAPESYAWIPFGGGVRRCLGAAFAQLEMRVVISRILARAELRPSRSRDERVLFRGITLVPSRGGEAVVERVRP
jgi:cytochrome P450